MRTDGPARSPWPPPAATVDGVGIRIAAARTVARAIVTAALLAALTAVVAATLRLGGVRADDNHGRPLLWYAAAWALFGAAAWTVRKVPVGAATVLVLVGGAAIAVAALVAPPRTSDDTYRYAWDGRMQAAGISPYAYPPAAPELAALRDGWLFPPAPSATTGSRTRSATASAPSSTGPPCTPFTRPSPRAGSSPSTR
jgi:hypothetical protein